ncbi:beta-ketoacyl synthase [Hydrococcus rivularis NIES-593]|uniref:Beta-ketoacyl synthase n=1 Tax=Hydrococcus rivularis NIES-593 TaxID=1921803 RepID=A0A1U7H6X5_9CYAN|nr:type I polyketide synthase [Hydrococcus rivularis]OKH17705.1 beta-ketoacyl synthase [Hydrococcus rivularis NIES-593]
MRSTIPLEPIAIVGIGCRFPGANNPESFWQLLRNGVEAISEVPKSRWDVDRFYDPDPAKPGKTHTRRGGFLEDIDRFDPQFFGISPREANTIDPQQRLLLEVAWEALEDGGQIPEQLAGTQTGVFIGIGTHDYSIMLWQHPVSDPYATTGTGNCIAANRISYAFDFKGPSLAVDTACSSSLVAIHLACQSIWTGESTMALAGGVNVILLPTVMVGFAKGGFLSGDGRCKSFDTGANGYVRSEGAGIVVLKPLSQAQADGDDIYAVIRGSAVNQDGWTNGLAAPNPLAQEAVIREACRRAGVSPSQIQYVEAHGTGTKIGDPIEMQALGAVLAEGRESGDYCAVGSVKTNIGHAETAAGVAGLIKVALALKYKQIPPSLHFQEPNPAIAFDKLPLRVQTTLTPWLERSFPALAGVNSFGFGGTNAHVVLEEFHAQTIPPAPLIKGERPLHLLTLSAKSEKALRELAGRYKEFLESHLEVSLPDVCFTANTRRSQFNHRLAIVTKSTEQLRSQLEAFASGQEISGLVRSQITSNRISKIAFLFTGQGSQYVGMGSQLYQTQPTFRATLDRCAEILQPYLEKPLLEVLYPSQIEKKTRSPIDETAYTQPALFALEYALYELWKSWGISPTAVIGHSVGEYVAACIAGVFSLEDGLKLIAARGRLMQQLPQDGSMVAVFASEEIVSAAIAPYQEQVNLAAINGYENLVISGKRQAIERIVSKLQAEGIETKQLNVSHAFHSPLMEPILAQFETVARQITYSPPQITLISNLTGRAINSEIATPEYWCRHIRQPVCFAQSIETLHRLGYQAFVEIGAKPTLLGMARSILEPKKTSDFCTDPKFRVSTSSEFRVPSSDFFLWLPSLRPGASDWQQLLQSLGELYVRGVKVDWLECDRNSSRTLVHLPTYPFQRQRFWWESPKFNECQSPIQNPNHPLLGQRLHLAGTKEIRFQAQISQDSPAYLKDHCLDTQPIFPATAYLEMALAAGANLFKSDRLRLEEFAIAQPLVLPENQLKTLQIILIPETRSGYSFQIFSSTINEETTESSFTLHASGKVNLEDKNEQPFQSELAELQADFSQNPLSVLDYYQQLREQGLCYGKNFQGIKQLWQVKGQVLGQIQLPETLTFEAENYLLHPVLLDSCFQLLGAAFANDERGTYLPVGLERLHVYRRSSHYLWSRVKVGKDNPTNGYTTGQRLKADLQLFDENGILVAQIEGLSLQYVSRQSIQKLVPEPKQENLEDWLYEVVWQPSKGQKAESLGQKTAENWLIFADQRGIGVKLAKALEEKGDRATLIFPGQSYAISDEGHYQIDPTQPEDFQRLFEQIKSCCEIVHLWGLEETTDLQQAQVLGCGSVLHLVQALIKARFPQLPKLWLATRGTQPVGMDSTPIQVQQSSLWGLRRVIRLEHPDLPCKCLDLDPSEKSDDIPTLLEELYFPDAEDQIAYRQGIRYVPRLMQRTSQTQSDTPIQLKISDYGILDNLTPAPATRCSPAPGEVEIQVCAAGVNFRDVLNALGMLKEYLERMGFADAAEVPFGGECAGKIVAVGEGVEGLQVGDEVIAAQAIGSLSSFVTVDARFVVRKPKELSFEEAATIPTTFLTAYYGLHYLAKIKKGDRLLIHSAAGGVGQAAIQLAQKAGAEVLATASPKKWEFLKSMGVKNVMNSRTLDFAEEVMALTDGQGVDIVLNSFNGEFIAKNLEILAPGGRFVEIGKIGIWDESQVREKRADVAYFPFDLLNVSQDRPSLIASMLEELIQEFHQRSLRPLPHTVFPIEEAASAFRYMAQAKHIGKVVISLPQIASQPFMIRKDGSYLITGGLGALGLQVARWLVEQGAKHLVLVGRSQPSQAAQETISQLEKAGAQVIVVQADVSKPEDVARIIALSEKIQSKIQLRGIIHAAGILDDGVLLKQTWERFERVMAPKVQGAWNLHVATQDLALDFFVCFSSIASLIGSPGQGNYAAANAFMDALVHYRRGMGLPALSVNWGVWADVGMAAELSAQNQARLEQQGLSAIASQQGLQLLKALLQQQATQVGAFPVNWSIFLKQLPETSFFEAITPKSEENSLQSRSEFLQQLESAASSDRKTLLFDRVRSQVAKVLGFSSPELIEPQQNFGDLGMDSLMAVELKNSLQASLGIPIALTSAFDHPTIELLTNYLAQELSAGEFVDGFSTQSSVRSPGPNSINQLTIQSNEKSSTPGMINKSIVRSNEQAIVNESPNNNGSKASETLINREIRPENYQFRLMPEYINLRKDLERVEQLGNPFFEVYDGIAADAIRIGDRELINYSSYNYLGMSGDATVSQAAMDAIARYGTSVSASRVVSGERPLHRELEREIADFLGTEDCIAYIGGHATNVTTIGHLFGKNDLILCDALSHNSIREGCKLSGATIIEFPHNDWQTLDRILSQRRHEHEKVLIAIEGIYSTDGDLPYLPEFVKLKKQYKAFILVDEAHSIGVLGIYGRGIGEYFGIAPADVDLWMGTLSKSFASCGGYIAGCREVVEYLKYTAPGFVFSVGMSPPNAAAALAAIRLLKAEPERVSRLRDRAKLFLELAKSKRLNTGSSQDSPIVPIIVGEPYKAVQLSQALSRRGINVQPMVYPSVPYNASRLRFFISCTHTEEQIHFTIDAIAQEIAKLN